jgi:hypothetical protein
MISRLHVLRPWTIGSLTRVKLKGGGGGAGKEQPDRLPYAGPISTDGNNKRCWYPNILKIGCINLPSKTLAKKHESIP